MLRAQGFNEGGGPVLPIFGRNVHQHVYPAGDGCSYPRIVGGVSKHGLSLRVGRGRRRPDHFRRHGHNSFARVCPRTVSALRPKMAKFCLPLVELYAGEFTAALPGMVAAAEPIILPPGGSEAATQEW